MSRPHLALRILLALHVALGAGVVAALVFSSPMVLGTGSFDSLASQLESFDFKWWSVGLALLLWLGPLLLVLTWRRASLAGVEIARVRSLVEDTLKDRALPVMVDVQGRIPVSLDAPLTVPVELHTVLDFDDEIEFEAEIPVRAEIPVDTEIETNVLRFGTVRIPFRALIPVDVVVPVKSRVRVKAKVPVNLVESATVRIPPLDVPVSSRLETRVDLLESIKAARGLMKKG